MVEEVFQRSLLEKQGRIIRLTRCILSHIEEECVHESKNATRTHTASRNITSYSEEVTIYS